MSNCIIETPLGITKITGNAEGISAIKVLDTKEVSLSDNIHSDLKDCVLQLNEYFNETRKSFSFKMNPNGSDFQKRVWKKLLDIPYGETISYLELSNQLGDPKAIRAVASANGKNPLWIVIPCHRVIGSDGNLTGYAGGLYRKQWLLNHEKGMVQHTLF